MTARVVLVGPPGAGKSVVANELGRLLDVAVADSDVDVERRAGKPVADIFVDDGEAAFRELERAVVVELLATHDGILALGGGAVMDPRTEADLAGQRVVFLDVSLAEAIPRVGLTGVRPLLLASPRSQWQALMAVRRPIYERVAWRRVPTDGLTPHEVAIDIARSLAADANQEDR